MHQQIHQCNKSFKSKRPEEWAWRCHPLGPPASGWAWTASQRGWRGGSRWRPPRCSSPRPPARSSPPPCGPGCSPPCSCPEISRWEMGHFLDFKMRNGTFFRSQNEKWDILSASSFFRNWIFIRRSVCNKDIAISISFARHNSGIAARPARCSNPIPAPRARCVSMASSTTAPVWYGMVWCGMVVWYGMVWFDMVWCGLVCINGLPGTSMGHHQNHASNGLLLLT